MIEFIMLGDNGKNVNSFCWGGGCCEDFVIVNQGNMGIIFAVIEINMLYIALIIKKNMFKT